MENAIKIEELNLVALRKYACPKVNNQKEWFLKCVDCKGISDCRVGKRALKIIEEQTKPIGNEKMVTFPLSPEMIAKLRAGSHDERADKFLDAVGTRDPLGYLLEKGFFSSRWRANDSLKRFLSNRGLACYADGDLNQKSKEGTIQSIIRLCTKYKTANELAQNIHASWSIVYKWPKKYPELEPYKDILLEAAKIMQHARYVEKKEAAKSMAESHEDEVSIMDFLKESELENNEILNQNDLEETENISVSHTSNQDVLQIEFRKKVLDLNNRMKMIEARIEQLHSLKNSLYEQLNILDKTAELFGIKQTNSSQQKQIP